MNVTRHVPIHPANPMDFVCVANVTPTTANT
jgi:hypothetical protein